MTNTQMSPSEPTGVPENQMSWLHGLPSYSNPGRGAVALPSETPATAISEPIKEKFNLADVMISSVQSRSPSPSTSSAVEDQYSSRSMSPAVSHTSCEANGDPATSTKASGSTIPVLRSRHGLSFDLTHVDSATRRRMESNRRSAAAARRRRNEEASHLASRLHQSQQACEELSRQNQQLRQQLAVAAAGAGLSAGPLAAGFFLAMPPQAPLAAHHAATATLPMLHAPAAAAAAAARPSYAEFAFGWLADRR